MRILLVLDHSDYAHFFSSVLNQEGHKVRTVHIGRAGVLEARFSKPDVIVSDIGLPDLNGYELAKQLRSLDVLEGTLMIAISGDADVQEALDAGFNHHLLKPVDWETLRRLLSSPASRSLVP